MKQSKIWLTLIAVILVLGAAAAFFTKRVSAKLESNKTTQVIVAEVKNASSNVGMIAQGTVVPADTVGVSVNPGFQGQVMNVYADIGSRVTKGQVLAQLDPTYEQDALQESQLTLETSKQRDQLTRVPYLPEQIETRRLALDNDRLAIASSEKRLTLLQEGARPQQIVESQEAVDSATTKLSVSQATYDRNVALFAKDLIPRVEVDTSNADLTLAKNELTRAQAALSLVQEGARPEQISIEENTLEQAKVAYQRDNEEYLLMLKGSRSEDIAISDLAVRNAAVDAQAKSRDYNYRLVRAPISGVILARNVNPGEFATPMPSRTSSTAPLQNLVKTLFTIADDSSVLFQASVDQRFFNTVRIGQTAQVGVEALPGRNFSGTVVNISRLINTDAGTRISGNVINPSAPLTFAVMVKVPNPDHLLIPGEIGLITFHQRQAGIVIPQSALTSFTLGAGVVYVEDGGFVKARPIRYDSNLDGQVRVLHGLRPGERVVVSSPITLTDGLPVQSKMADADDLGTTAL